ncbi:SAS complex subunit [Zygosaccharomyces mellis]|uniref:histone acetyltransferase n=1 Tax=Zygosaccharomyces mellis TaxID=42258 RepID=A0A4C2E212_9SACH|nr:SAS complex subunit [Zygosaccharomyces mellis]
MSHDGEDLYGILNERNIREVQFGTNKIFSTWYGSNVYFDPDIRVLGYLAKSGSSGFDGSNGSNRVNNHEKEDTQYWLDTLYVCEYCFKYADNGEDLASHANHCKFQRHSPGKIKYKSPKYTVKRVKGSKHRLFCQCLCLFTKLFLDNKSMYFKVDHYEFYIIYETSSTKPLGFFSKDTVSYYQNNLACVLIFPPYQRRQLGTFLLDFSYKVSKSEGLISGPEFPLSPFGLIGYVKYWSLKICWEFAEGELANLEKVTLEDISSVTGFRVNDIITALKYLECLGDSNEIYLSILRKKLNRNGCKALVEDEFLLLED